MTEPKRIAPSRRASTDECLDMLVADVRLEDELDAYDVDEDADVVWVPAEQPAKRGRFAHHEGQLALLAVCDDCGETTHTTAEQHLFVPCAHCDGEITITWDPALA